jgi:hypothetical protein
VALTNLPQFKKELDREFATQVVGKYRLLKNSIAQQTFATIVAKSPVWSGRYRGSHRIAINGLDESVAEPVVGFVWPNPVPPGQQRRALAASEVQARLLGTLPFDNITISNSVPYAGVLEDGSSGQAPLGVYEVSAEAINEKFRNVTLR